MSRSNWRQIIQPEDLCWVEWHREIMTYQFGRVMLKIWQAMPGHFMASVTKPNGDRGVTGLEASNVKEAKKEAEQWVLDNISSLTEFQGF